MDVNGINPMNTFQLTCGTCAYMRSESRTVHNCHEPQRTVIARTHPQMPTCGAYRCDATRKKS